MEAFNIFNILSSVQSQLEFLTLTGIIFGALMQGYICINSIYVYLIENIENEPLDFSHSAFRVDKKSEKEDVIAAAKSFHQARIHSVLVRTA